MPNTQPSGKDRERTAPGNGVRDGSGTAATGRRRVLQAAMALMAAPLLTGSLPGTARAAASSDTASGRGAGKGADLPLLTARRTLGSGRAAMEVSALGYGVMGCTYNRGVSPDRKEMVKLIRQAAEHGVTLFDTAEIYGPYVNEELAGEALEPWKGRVIITTKFGHDIEGGRPTGRVDSRPATIRRVCEASLKRLRVDAIELFYQHRYDPKVPVEDVAGTVADLIREGKVRRFGLCEVGADTVRRAHAVCPVTAVQSEYHLMWREPEKELFPTLEELGIGFVPYSPLNRGMLGGGFTPYTRFGANDNRAGLPRFQPENLFRNLEFVEAVSVFARPLGLTCAQVALGWLMRSPRIVPIPGTTKLSHLEENIRAANVSLADADWNRLEAALGKLVVRGDRYGADEQKKINR